MGNVEDWNRQQAVPPCGHLIIAVSLIMGLLSLAVGIFLLLITQESRTWPSTQGVISESWWMQGTKSSCAVIRYKYRVGERSYEGNSILPYSNEYSQAEQRLKVDQYPVGANVKVFYDPNHPQNSCLEVGVVTTTPFALFGVAVLCAAVVISYSRRIWRVRRIYETMNTAPRVAL